MRKKINLKERIVCFWEINTGEYEKEIVSFLDRQMKVRFYSAYFNNSKYIFIGNPNDGINNSITVSGYRVKAKDENYSVDIG